jgi:hypothetical protein
VFKPHSSKQESVESFWERTEAELGETVELYDMAYCPSGCLAGDVGIWGLAFVTNRALYFHHFPKRNWFTSVVTQDASADEQELKLEVDRDSIRAVQVHREESLLRRIFTYSPPVLEIRYLDRQGNDALMRLNLDSKLDAFERLLTPT